MAEEPIKQSAGHGEGGEEEHSRNWADMFPDILSNIFMCLPLEQLAMDIPCICQPWRHICLRDAAFWETVDLTQFAISHGLSKAYRLMSLLVKRRSQGRLREFTFPSITDPSLLDDLVVHAPLLRKLHIRSSCVNYVWAEYAARVLTCIEDLDVSLCNSVMFHSGALAILGKHCRHIAILRRNKSQQLRDGPACDADALAIAENYPVLKHLELQNNRLSAGGLRAILDKCPLLEYLDLRGCANIARVEDLLSECRTRLKAFHDPSSMACFNEYHDSYKLWQDDVYHVYDEDAESSGGF